MTKSDNKTIPESIAKFVVETLADPDTKKSPEMVAAIAGLINSMCNLVY